MYCELVSATLIPRPAAAAPLGFEFEFSLVVGDAVRECDVECERDCAWEVGCEKGARLATESSVKVSSSSGIENVGLLRST